MWIVKKEIIMIEFFCILFVVIFSTFVCGYIAGSTSEKNLWTRNCLRDMPHYSDGIPYIVTKLGVPYYADDVNEMKCNCIDDKDACSRCK